MLPGKSTIYVAPYTDAVLHAEPWTKSSFWLQSDFHGQNLTALHPHSVDSQFATPVVDALAVENLLGTPVSYPIDLHTVTKEELQRVRIPLSFESTGVGVIHGAACWFDVEFDPPDNTCEPLVLNTAPGAPLTHWWQTALLLKQPIGVNAGQRLKGMLTMDAHSMQSYNVKLSLQLAGVSGVPPSEQSYDLKNPLYRCANHHQIPVPNAVPAMSFAQQAVANLGATKRTADTMALGDTDAALAAVMGLEAGPKRSKP